GRVSDSIAVAIKGLVEGRGRRGTCLQAPRRLAGIANAILVAVGLRVVRGSWAIVGMVAHAIMVIVGAGRRGTLRGRRPDQDPERCAVTCLWITNLDSY